MRDGNVPPNNSKAEFSVAALGKPPLSFQWWADGTPVGGATNRTLTFLNPTSGGQGTNFSVVVSNDSGSVTSQVAVLRIVSTNQPPVPAAISSVAFQGQSLTLYLSDLVQSANDPDHDAVVFLGADSSSTNGLALGLNNVQQVGATLVYTPSDAYVGADQFNWGTGSPDPGITADFFLVRWHGQVQPLYTDLYTFYTTTDDGARLWVNGQLVVNRWQNQAATTASGTIPLAANQKYDLVMEYYENTSAASARLSWSSLYQPQAVIPMSQLYPSAGLVQPALTADLSNRTNLVLNWPGSFTLQSAPDVTGPWTTVTTSIVSPYSIPVGATGTMFFRLATPISP